MILVIVILIFGYLVLDSIKKFITLNKISFKLKGPTPLPIVGNLIQIGDKGHKVLLKYHEKYGDVYRIWMGDYFTIVVRDIDMIKKMYIDNAYVFLNHSDTPSNQYFSHNFGGLPFNLDKSEWKKRRVITAGALSKVKLRNVYNSMNSIIGQLLENLKQHSISGEPFEPHYHSDKLLSDINFKLFFNSDPDRNDVKSKEFQKFSDAVNQIVVDLGTGKLSDFVYMLQPLLLKYYQWTYKHMNFIDKFIEREYNEHVETFKPEYNEDPRDFLDTLIVKMGEHYEGDDIKKMVLELLFNIFIASIDTTAGTIEWAYLYLANYPDIQEEVYQELKTVIGDRELLPSDRNSTPLLNAFIKELNRIKPVVPFNIPRLTTDDVEIDGIFIPKNTHIIANTYGVGYCEKYFPNPSEFNPSRFLNPHINYSVFSYGPRGCVGQHFAMDILFLSIGNIIKSYKVSKPNGTKISEEGKLGLSFRPFDFTVSIEERK
ncbi:hypothetical protein CYY_002917 [Polysphondylium violaceum]|uniref:Cytochrome P450 family protein n=1 Tax=Polysphondylium violaceum TaxID=133409 RepID=A0A8J4PZD7_9MYCE|nr:hypothetical protein CYY_002917 [Polysphondylium violaceum]